MKNTAIAIAMMTLVLIGTTLAQPKRRVAQSTALGGGSGVGVKNRQPVNFRKRIDKASPLANLGDTGTHEVGHQGKRRHPIAGGDGTTQQFRTRGPQRPASLTNTTSYDFRKDPGKAAQYNPKEIGIDKTRNIAPRKTTGFTEVTGLDIQVESKQARRKRQ